MTKTCIAEPRGTPEYVCSSAEKIPVQHISFRKKPEPLGKILGAVQEFPELLGQYTTTPAQEGQPEAGIPEFCRVKTTIYFTGLSRGKIYQGINEGWVKSVSLRKKGQKFSVRLIHLPSLLQHLHALMNAQQNRGLLNPSCSRQQ